MEFLDTGDARIGYRVRGNGPPLLAPECNYTWSDVVEERLAEQFTVIIASPRDFGPSTRTGGPSYEASHWATDLYAVARHVGHERFLFFGYSFTGAFGPWLARRLRTADAVVAVASGGFPLIGDYGLTAADVDEQANALQQDPDVFAQIVQHRFDPLAARDFYRDLATLAPDALVDDLPCPLYCFWGDQDTDAVEMVLPHEAYMAGLRRRHIPFDVYPGFDHEGLSGSLEIALPTATAWLLSQAREEGLTGRG